MTFLSTAAMVGLMSASRPNNGLNLINAPSLAQDTGLTVSQTHAPGENKLVSVIVSSPSAKHTIKGNYYLYYTILLRCYKKFNIINTSIRHMLSNGVKLKVNLIWNQITSSLKFFLNANNISNNCSVGVTYQLHIITMITVKIIQVYY